MNCKDCSNVGNCPCEIYLGCLEANNEKLKAIAIRLTEETLMSPPGANLSNYRDKHEQAVEMVEAELKKVV